MGSPAFPDCTAYCPLPTAHCSLLTAYRLISRSAWPQRQSRRTFNSNCVKLAVLAVLDGRVEADDVGGGDFFGNCAEERAQIVFACIDAAPAGFINQSAYVQGRGQRHHRRGGS